VDWTPTRSTPNAMLPQSSLIFYEPIAKVGTGCTLGVTGANPASSAYDPAARPADAQIADFTNDRGDTVKGDASTGTRHGRQRRVPGVELPTSIRTGPALEPVGASERVERKAGTGSLAPRHRGIAFNRIPARGFRCQRSCCGLSSLRMVSWPTTTTTTMSFWLLSR